MRKNFIDYYALAMLMLFIIYNLFLESLKIYGLLYQIFMFVIIIVNAIILIAFRKRIKYKTLIIIVYLLIWLFSKNTLQCFFAFLNASSVRDHFFLPPLKVIFQGFRFLRAGRR